jgi:two-component system nitrogen regulation sensor histidine kinase NtrY
MSVSTPEPGQDWLQRNLFWVARTSWPSYVLIAMSLAAVVATYLILTGSTPIEASPNIRLYLTVLDALLLLALVALVIGRLVQLWIGRRSGSAGARLHGRLVTIFSLIAVVPVVLTAGAAAITINLAMEAWFSSGVRGVLTNSVSITKCLCR